jgi:cytoskeleton protein RodZ
MSRTRTKTRSTDLEAVPENGAETIVEAPTDAQQASETLPFKPVEPVEPVEPAVPLAAEVRVGQQLTAARETLKLSVSDIAQRLRLGERQVIALETGDLAALPGKTFVRGFVRNYARAVALDATLLLETLNGVDGLTAPGLNLPESTHVAMPNRQGQGNRDSLMVTAGVILLLAAVLLYFFWPDQSWLQIRSDQWTEAQQATPAWTQPADDPAPAPVAPEADGTVAILNISPTGTAPAEPAITAPVTPVTKGDARFSFAQDSWVEVRDKNGVILSSRQHAAGESLAVSGAPPLTVIIGKASGVTLLYRGKPVILRPRADDVARVILP